MTELQPIEKLKQLRLQMQQQNIDAWVLMSADPHMSEYLPDHWKIRQWLTGFTGSVGTLLVTQDFAGLWVDGRYWVQAEQQLAATGIELQKLTPDQSSTHLAWIAQQLSKDAVLAVDAQIISVQQFKALTAIADQQQIKLNTTVDLINPIWSDRPALPVEAVWMMKDGLNALSHIEKIALVRQQLAQRNIDAHFISALDDIAWLLNCRGRDVEYNPVFLAHLYLDQQQVILFIDPAKLSPALQQQLQADGIRLKPYTDSVGYLNALDPNSVQQLWIDPAKVSLQHAHALDSTIHIVEDINPSTRLKAQKHPSELQHIRHAMLKDGVALCHFFAWLEQHLAQKLPLNELDIDDKISAYRAEQEGFLGLSFSTIAGYNANGALPHYRATPEHFSQIAGDGLLLIDSGGQYQDGTTDITRVVPVGQPSEQQKRDYTLVLKSHIALARAVFPEGLAAPLLDAIARQPLWQQHLDYRHGTGHGVGFALNVHEGPQVLSYYAPIGPYSGLLEGMIVSNEPGLYHQDQYGIRIENLVTATAHHHDPSTPSSYGKFLSFENLTLCPIHQHCIVHALLDQQEKAWLNDYHLQVRTQLAAHLDGPALDWLMRETAAL
ncbi:Xaa-Pro aminopeptidase [Acinetobacter calcoaceticus]|uniref:Xaa-Pro aminopeptidase n=1 Tax=Acinetobacter calcoaceticus TaxID=471 RepID=A0A4R1XVN5_ACICA|nr:Xaa-Pro aminopeptidase [Acinetobacter calcoaceticus]